jgi:hypothetical protein
MTDDTRPSRTRQSTPTNTSSLTTPSGHFGGNAGEDRDRRPLRFAASLEEAGDVRFVGDSRNDRGSGARVDYSAD